MNELETMKLALIQIGNLPLEFNTRARGIAQRAINNLGRCEWRNALTDDQIYKAVNRGGLYPVPPLEETKMEEKNETTTYTPPQIDMVPVESSNIESVGHDGAKTLRVKFIGGAHYDYPGITEEEFFDLVNAPSVGKSYGALTRARGIKGIKLQEGN